MSSLKDTIEKIKNLETEKKNLLLEIEELKKMDDAKATALGSARAKSPKNLMNEPKPSVKRKPKK